MNALPLFSFLSLQTCWHVPCWKEGKLFGRFFFFVLLKSLKPYSVPMMSFLPPWPSWRLFCDLCSPWLPEIHRPLDSLLLFSSNFISSQNLWSRSKNKPFRVSQLEITSSFIIIIVISFSFSCYNFFLLVKSLLQFPLEHFFSLTLQESSLSYSTALLDIYVSFPQEYCSSVLDIYHIQFLSVFVLSTFTTVLCQKKLEILSIVIFLTLRMPS